MACKSCKLEKQALFPSEIAIHFPGLKELSNESVFVFPQLLVCLDCGFTEFSISEAELRRLAQDSSDRIA
jgi:hypothetical protein